MASCSCSGKSAAPARSSGEGKAVTVLHPAPKIAPNEGVLERLTQALGDMVVASKEEYGEIVLTIARNRIEDALRLLRDGHEYQQLMEIAGVDYPDRVERFEVVYMLLSLTRAKRYSPL